MTLVLWMELIKAIFAGHFKDTHTHAKDMSNIWNGWLQNHPFVQLEKLLLMLLLFIYYYLDIKVFDIFDRHTHLQSTYGCYFAAMLDYREENVFRLLSFESSLRIAGWSTTLPYANCSGPYSPLGKRQRWCLHDLQTYYVGGPMTKNSALLQPRSTRASLLFFMDVRVQSVVGFSWESCLPVHFCKNRQPHHSFQ